MTSAHQVGTLAQAAAEAFPILCATSARAPGHWLNAVADALEADANYLVTLAREESHLTETRLRGELARTTYQLRSFETVISHGVHTMPIIEHPNLDHPIGPTPDLRRLLYPIWPVAVYAASNFPFAFSVAGGDTASALSAG